MNATAERGGRRVGDPDLKELRMLAQSAMDKATEARHAVDMHEAVCAQRYKGIIDGVAELRTIMKGAVMLIMSVLAIVLWSYLKASLKI